MNYQQLDTLADFCDPLLILGLLFTVFWLRKGAAWPFVLRSALAVGLSQQLCKFSQKHHVLGGDFPSTHFAVALALLTCFVVLKRQFWPWALGFVVVYGVLMLFQHYHTPGQMLGAFFAVPLTWLFHFQPRQAAVATN